ncbi:MAG: hypothetical protein WAV05_11855 [Anaerolineales bacterium]
MRRSNLQPRLVTTKSMQLQSNILGIASSGNLRPPRNDNLSGCHCGIPPFSGGRSEVTKQSSTMLGQQEECVILSLRGAIFVTKQSPTTLGHNQEHAAAIQYLGDCFAQQKPLVSQ